MFDLPTITRDERHDYRIFRERIIDRGFSMMQFSVYGRSCPSDDAAEVHRAAIREFLPAGGEVRVLSITDIQMGKMQVFLGGKRKRKKAPSPQQLLLF